MPPMLPRRKERQPPRPALHRSGVAAAFLVALIIATPAAGAVSAAEYGNSRRAAAVVQRHLLSREEGASAANARPVEGRSLTASAAEGAAASAALWRLRMHRLSSTSVNNQKLSTLLGPVLSYEVGPAAPPQ